MTTPPYRRPPPSETRHTLRFSVMNMPSGRYIVVSLDNKTILRTTPVADADHERLQALADAMANAAANFLTTTAENAIKEPTE